MTPDLSSPEDPSAQEHFVHNVVCSSYEVNASEDIVSANGVKLLAKGTRVDAPLRERLISHKLAKPLEQSLEVAGAITPELLRSVAVKVFDEWPLLCSLHGPSGMASSVDALVQLPLNSKLRSLLTLYAELPSDKLEHCVAVALASVALSRRAAPSHDETQERILLTAGLFHDVGELYLDPTLVRQPGRLGPEQWKHVVVHPLVGYRVLRHMPGAGSSIAEAVLHHHERRDGFGYPQGKSQDEIPLRGEMLAAAEWLAGMMRNGRADSIASMSARLMPGNFKTSISVAISAAFKGEASSVDTSAHAAGHVLSSLVRVLDAVQRFRSLIPSMGSIAPDGSEASALLAANRSRMEMVERSLARSGLAGDEPLVLFERLGAMNDARLFQELSDILREVEWRLAEIERDTLMRASMLPSDQKRMVQEFLRRLNDAELPIG